MRGRRPAGPEYVEHLPGSELAKERLRVILETIAGNTRVLEACQRLGICEQRFHQLRHEALTAALAGMEPGTPGRPPVAPTPAEQQVQALQEQLAAKDQELRAALARTEIALIMPGVLQPATPDLNQFCSELAEAAKPQPVATPELAAEPTKRPAPRLPADELAQGDQAPRSNQRDLPPPSGTDQPQHTEKKTRQRHRH